MAGPQRRAAAAIKVFFEAEVKEYERQIAERDAALTEAAKVCEELEAKVSDLTHERDELLLKVDRLDGDLEKARDKNKKASTKPEDDKKTKKGKSKK